MGAHDDTFAVASVESEARGLLALAQNGQGVESVRKEIRADGTDVYRNRVLRVFDLFVARLPKHGNKLRQRVNTRFVSDELKAEALKLLRSGLSHEAVLKQVPIGAGVILALSKAHLISSTVKRGRGRRLSPEVKAAIMERVRAGTRSSEIQKEFGVDYDTTILFRRMVGDIENRRHWRKLSASDLERAQRLLEQGGKWLNVAREVNVSPACLQKNLAYRKGNRMTNCKRWSIDRGKPCVCGYHLRTP